MNQTDGSECRFLVLLKPMEQQKGLDSAQKCDTGQ